MSDTKSSEVGANFESVRARVEDRRNFDEFMARNTARLMDYAKKYVGRLPSLERELFLSRALRAAWDTRMTYSPQREAAGLLLWWETCLRTAALSRRYWHQLYQDDVRLIAGKDLGR